MLSNTPDPQPQNTPGSSKLPPAVSLALGSVVIFVGPPASGKGTQSKALAEAANIAHISTGDLLRAEVSKGSVLGSQAKHFMDQGKLVPDALLHKLLQQRLAQPDCKQGFVLDGYPRSLSQAQNLENLLQKFGHHVEKVIELAVPEQELKRRMQARGRADDIDASFANRLKSYSQDTGPVLSHYRSKGALEKIDASNPIQDVQLEILSLF